MTYSLFDTEGGWELSSTALMYETVLRWNEPNVQFLQNSWTAAAVDSTPKARTCVQCCHRAFSCNSVFGENCLSVEMLWRSSCLDILCSHLFPQRRKRTQSFYFVVVWGSHQDVRLRLLVTVRGRHGHLLDNSTSCFRRIGNSASSWIRILRGLVPTVLTFSLSLSDWPPTMLEILYLSYR